MNSNGVKFYLADHPEDERLFNTGHQDIAYRHFLDWLGGRSPTRSASCSTPTTRPTGCTRRRRCSMRLLDAASSRRDRTRTGRDLVAGRDDRLGLPVFHAQGTAGPGPQGEPGTPQFLRTGVP